MEAVCGGERGTWGGKNFVQGDAGGGCKGKGRGGRGGEGLTFARSSALARRCWSFSDSASSILYVSTLQMSCSTNHATQ